MNKEKNTFINYKVHDIPTDGNCLFWATMLAYLEPIKTDNEKFKSRYIKLFGNDDNYEKIFNFSNFDFENNKNLVLLFRNNVVKYMKKNNNNFQNFNTDEDNDFDKYLTNMKKDGSWGGELEIKAISDLLKTKIYVNKYENNKLLLSKTYSNSESSNNSYENEIKIIHINNNHYQYYLSNQVEINNNQSQNLINNQPITIINTIRPNSESPYLPKSENYDVSSLENINYWYNSQNYDLQEYNNYWYNSQNYDLRKDENNDLRKDLEKEKNENYDLRKDLEKEKDENYDLRKDLEKEKDKNYDLRKDLNNEKDKNYDLRKDLNNEKDKNNVNKKQTENQLKSSFIKKSVAKEKEKNENYDLRKDLNNEKDENYDLRKDLEKEKNENYDLRKDLEKEKDKNYDLRKDLNNEKDKNYDLRKDLEKEKDKNYDLRKDLNNEKDKNNVNKKQTENQLKSSFIKKSVAKEKEKNENYDLRKDLKNQKDEINNTLNKVIQEKEILFKENQTLINEKNHLEIDLNKACQNQMLQKESTKNKEKQIIINNPIHKRVYDNSQTEIVDNQIKKKSKIQITENIIFNKQQNHNINKSNSVIIESNTNNNDLTLKNLLESDSHSKDIKKLKNQLEEANKEIEKLKKEIEEWKTIEHVVQESRITDLENENKKLKKILNEKEKNMISSPSFQNIESDLLNLVNQKSTINEYKPNSPKM